MSAIPYEDQQEQWFYAGVRIEKSQISSSSGSGASLPSAAAGGSGTRTPTGCGSRAALPAGPSPFGGSGNSSIGTVSSVNGRTLYVKDSTGNTIEVKLSSATDITKSVKVSKGSVRPGDSVIVQGLKRPTGTLTASSVSDSGATNTGSTSTGSGSSASSGGGSSGVNSLFGSRGGG